MDLIEEWESLLKKIPSEDIKERLTMELFKMYAERCAKNSLELAQDLANGKKEEEIELPSYIHYWKFQSKELCIGQD